MATRHEDAPRYHMCVPLTFRLLVSLEGATKAEVIKKLKANGRPLGRGEENVLHFSSVAFDDRYGGDVNFEIDDGGHVVRIFGRIDTGAQFVWNPSYHGSAANPCSDFPGSYYASCK